MNMWFSGRKGRQKKSVCVRGGGREEEEKRKRGGKTQVEWPWQPSADRNIFGSHIDRYRSLERYLVFFFFQKKANNNSKPSLITTMSNPLLKHDVAHLKISTKSAGSCAGVCGFQAEQTLIAVDKIVYTVERHGKYVPTWWKWAFFLATLGVIALAVAYSLAARLWPYDLRWQIGIALYVFCGLWGLLLFYHLLCLRTERFLLITDVNKEVHKIVLPPEEEQELI